MDATNLQTARPHVSPRDRELFAALAKLDAELARNPVQRELMTYEGLADSIAAASDHAARFGGEDR